MTDARYMVGCCDGTVAEIEVSGDRVTIRPPGRLAVVRAMGSETNGYTTATPLR